MFLSIGRRSESKLRKKKITLIKKCDKKSREGYLATLIQEPALLIFLIYKKKDFFFQRKSISSI